MKIVIYQALVIHIIVMLNGELKDFTEQILGLQILGKRCECFGELVSLCFLSFGQGVIRF